MALAGVVLALGGNTPLGRVLVHLPLFGDQRLQSRNILVADLALAVLLAYWADSPFGERSRQPGPPVAPAGWLRAGTGWAPVATGRRCSACCRRSR